MRWDIGPLLDPSSGPPGLKIADEFPADLRPGLAEYLVEMWRLRLSHETASGAGRATVVEALFHSDSSVMLVEPSTLILERTAGATRRLLTKGCFFISRRFAIAAAERIGKDPAEPPVGSGVRLGRRVLAARLLHVRMVSTHAAVAVVLTLAKSEVSGKETRVVVTSVLVDGPVFDQTLQQTSAPSKDGSATSNSQTEPEWKIVHEDSVVCDGLIANVPVLGMTALEPGFTNAGEAQISKAWPPELSEWYLASKEAAVVHTHTPFH